MSAITTSLMVCAYVFGGALLGVFLRRVLPELRALGAVLSIHEKEHDKYMPPMPRNEPIRKKLKSIRSYILF